MKSIPSGHLESDANDTYCVHGVSIFSGRFEADLASCDLGFVVEAVSESVDDAEDFDVAASGEANAESDIALHVILPRSRRIGGQRLVGDDDGCGVCLVLPGNMGAGLAIHVSAEGGRGDVSGAVARAGSADHAVAEAGRGDGAAVVAAARAMVYAGAEVDTMDGASAGAARTGVPAGCVVVRAESGESGLAPGAGVGVYALRISEAAGVD